MSACVCLHENSRETLMIRCRLLGTKQSRSTNFQQGRCVSCAAHRCHIAIRPALQVRLCCENAGDVSSLVRRPCSWSQIHDSWRHVSLQHPMATFVHVVQAISRLCALKTQRFSSGWVQHRIDTTLMFRYHFTRYLFHDRDCLVMQVRLTASRLLAAGI